MVKNSSDIHSSAQDSSHTSEKASPSKNINDSGNLNESTAVTTQQKNTSIEMTDNIDTTAKKRIHSDSPSNCDAKRPNLNDSLADQFQMDFENDTPHWVPLLFQAFDVLRVDVKSINDKLNNFETFKSDISKRVNSLEQKSVSTEKKLTEIEDGMNFVNNMCEDLKKEVSSLTQKNSNLQKTLDALTNQIDSNEQHNRSECLLLHGVPEGSKETPAQSKGIFAKQISQNVGIKIEENYIRRAHRLGKRRDSGKPRPIIARLWDSQLRNDIYSKKRECKGKQISITENLTKRRMQIKIEAEKRYGDKNVWTKEGRIYAKDDTGVIKTIIA